MEEVIRDRIMPFTECVLWNEALNWIAFRQYAEAIGPRPATILLIEDYLGELSAELESKRQLSVELLIAKAAQSKIRVISEFSSDGTIASIPHTVFSTYTYYEGDKEPFFESDTDRYDSLAVVTEDLEREFPSNTDDEETTVSDPLRTLTDVVTGETIQVPGECRQDLPHQGGGRRAQQDPPNRRRGRRPQYEWQRFAAEMVRRATVAPPKSQAGFEREMLEWCLTTWGREPPESQVREWVGPAFKALKCAPTRQ